MNKHGDTLLNFLKGMCKGLTKHEHKTQHLEHLEILVRELKISISNNHGDANRWMRLIDILLKEVKYNAFTILNWSPLMDILLKKVTYNAFTILWFYC